MNPTTSADETLSFSPDNHIVSFSPGLTPEEMKQKVDEAVYQLTGRLGLETIPNPYENRIFKASEEYPGKKRSIVLYPDRRLDGLHRPHADSTLLKNRSLEQESNWVKMDLVDTMLLKDQWIYKLASDLVATATAADAAGLSAIQIGEPARVCVVRISHKPEFVVMVNPLVLHVTRVSPIETFKTVTEGCLSFPGVTEKVERYRQVQVAYQDLDGKNQTMDLSIDSGETGPAAQAVQHEVEHFEGKLLLSNLNIIHRDRVRLHMKKVHRKLADITRKSGGRIHPMQALFGYIPDP